MKSWMANLFMNKIRKAIDDYAMIKPGDHILVGVSGGKDSSLLLYALQALSQYKIYDFKVMGLTVDHGLIGNLDTYVKHCETQNIPHVVYKEHYAVDLAHGQSHAPCYTCSRLRKGIIKRYALENGYNKIALGHTQDDLVETFLMNIIQHGKLATMPPVSTIESDVTMIRPLMYLDERSIIKSIENLAFPLMMDTCTFAENRLRSRADALIREIELTVPHFSDKVIQALANIDHERLL